MSRPYYTLAEWDPVRCVWCPQFGDYSRRVVVDEWRDAYKGNGLKYQIVASGDTQLEIDARLANEPAPPGGLAQQGDRRYD